ncbi:MAG: M48 family metallopeptidase [Syntrophobacteraceae bacterium]|nr:M48 family metallopeptidase [Syntrophobacteraceae bacterium]
MVESNWFLACFLLVYFLQNGFDLWLERLNLSYCERQSDTAPAGFEEFIDDSKLARTARYERSKAVVAIIGTVVSETTLLAILLSGLLPLLVRLFAEMGLSVVPAGLFFFFIPGLIQFLVDLPFDFYNTFVIEEKFGFNKSTLKLWVLDRIKGGVVGTCLFAAIFSLLLLCIEGSPRLWWLWGFLLLSGVQLVLAILYPVLLAPLFNKFEPVRNDELAAKIKAQMEKSGIRVKKILQMNAGIRSRHTNAYFTGLGKTKQIVLYDTLLESHTHEEILAVLAHEVGHYKKKHVPKQLIVFAGFSLAAFYGTWLFIQWPLLFSTFGFTTMPPYAGLFLAWVFWSKAGFFLQPLSMAISRRFEREADRFAAETAGSGEAMAKALKRVAADNLSNLNPHPLYVRFHYSHPPVVERVAALARDSRP